MKNNLFYCYSPTLKKELLEIGEKFTGHGINPSTGREYWIFKFSPELKSYLDGRKKVEHKYVKGQPNPKFKAD